MRNPLTMPCSASKGKYEKCCDEMYDFEEKHQLSEDGRKRLLFILFLVFPNRIAIDEISFPVV